MALLLLLFCFAFSSILALPEEPEFTYYKLYEAGKSAYTEERWYECAAFMRRALEDYKFYHGILWSCQQRCDRQIPVEPFPVDTPAFREEKRHVFRHGVPEVRIFEKFIKRALCLRRCKADRLPGRLMDYSNRVIEQEFLTLKPYSYMQLCYWKLGDLEHATSAAYTFLTRNPADTMMTENLNYYSNEKSYDQVMLKDLEETEYQMAYFEGIAAYEEKRFMDVIDKMERSLEAFFDEIGKCRAVCDALVPQQDRIISDFYFALADIYAQMLKCRTKCENRLIMIRGNTMDDFIASHFHYLQFAYWKESMVRKAAEAVATYLLYYPEDETMLFNKRYYLENYDLKLDHFVPRSECVRHYKRELLERRLLDFIEEKLHFSDDEYPKYRSDDYRDFDDDLPGLDDNEFANLENGPTVPLESEEASVDQFDVLSTSSLKPDEANNFVAAHWELMSPFWSPSSEILNNYEAKHGVKVLKKESELKGQYRFLADQLLNKEECNALLDLSKLAELGDGYQGKPSPHTQHEDFKGLTILRLAQLAGEGKVPLKSAKLLLDKTELARNLIETYFNLSTHLYFDYTHLVCRSSKINLSADDFALRSDLSHAIHGDNCVFRNGNCVKRFPAYTWRDFSAVIYLNDDFSGGEFIFSDKSRDVIAEIKPSCGQMVAFSGDTLHGVKAITKGTRCVVALWLTLDSSHEELERIKAQQMLAKIELSDDNYSLTMQSAASRSDEL